MTKSLQVKDVTFRRLKIMSAAAVDTEKYTVGEDFVGTIYSFSCRVLEKVVPGRNIAPVITIFLHHLFAFVLIVCLIAFAIFHRSFLW